MNDFQKRAFDIALKGHNILVMGAAGTGKTFVLQKIFQSLKEKGKNVFLTCTTGVACASYPFGMATTLHRYAGIEDCRHGPSEIASVIKNNRKYEGALHRIVHTDTLIIDECSMLSLRTFEILNYACQLKDASKLFGGIQLILCGDFLQLPPVSNQYYGDAGKFCFESTHFETLMTHRVILQEIVRQLPSEMLLKTVIEEVSKGIVSPQSTSFLQYLARPLPSTYTFEPILFAKNEQVDNFNRNETLALPGMLFQYQAKDSGNPKFLHSLTAQRILWLKIGMPVILLRNLSDSLYNGLRGSVYDIDEEGPLIEFPTANRIIRIPKVAFEVFSPTANANVATRVQYPLKAAFAITIHKAQGMTLDRVTIDCQNIFKPGQLGVALSRAKTSEGLRVLNFNTKYCIQHPKIVTDFLKQGTCDTQDDMTCCRHSDTSMDVKTKFCHHDAKTCEIVTDHDVDVSDDMNEEYFDEDFNKVMEEISQEDERNTLEIPEDFNISNLLTKLKFKPAYSPNQTLVNEIVENIDLEKFKSFVSKQFFKFTIFITKLNINTEPKVISSSALSSFYKELQSYEASTEYKMHCLILFENDNCFEKEHMHVAFQICSEIRNFLMQEKIELYKCSEKYFKERHITNASRARVRYVGGYCVAKLRQKYSRICKTYMYATSVEGQNVYASAKNSLTILNSLREEEQHLLSVTNDPDSLFDVSRRQNLSMGLTHISDDLFHVFLNLSSVCLTELVSQNLIQYGAHMFKVSLSNILQNTELHQQIIQVLSKNLLYENTSSIEINLFGNNSHDSSGEIPEILNCLVFNAESMNIIFEELLTKFMEVFFVQFRKDVKNAYKVEKTMAHRKQVKISKSKTTHEVNKTPNIKSTKMQDYNQTSCSNASGSGDEVSCHSDHEDDHWIQCDKCDSWLHRKCAGLANSRWWKKYSADGAQWVCKICKRK